MLAKYLAHYIIAIQNILYKSAQVLELVKKSNLVITYPKFSNNKLNNNKLSIQLLNGK